MQSTFIDAKLDGTKVTGANVSVKIDDAFMQAVKKGTPYMCSNIPLMPEEPVFRKEIDARALWQKIIHNAWACC